MNFIDPDFESKLITSYNEAKSVLKAGAVADYIPELAKSDKNKLGIFIKYLHNNDQFSYGDSSDKFTMQSISKVCSFLICQSEFSSKDIFTRVGFEPSGAPFSELTTLSDFGEKPNNPFINAGAIVICSMLASKLSFDDFRAYVAQLCDTDEIFVNEEIYKSESSSNSRNHSLAWELKRLGLLLTEPEGALDFYTLMCSLEVNLEQLASLAALLANNGVSIRSGEVIIPEEHVKTTLSLMFTCGLYDGTGSFAVHTGLPAKSGVGGGIIAVKQGEFGLATFGPALDKYGNSIGGIKLITALSQRLHWHIFSTKQHLRKIRNSKHEHSEE